MTTQDVRWIQLFNHFKQAFTQFQEAVLLANKRDLSKLEEQGLIHAFEDTHELAWNTIKDFLVEHGTQNLYGSKDTTREAFKQGLIEDGEIWMEMIASRNLTSHVYNEDVASKIKSMIFKSYYPEFERFQNKFDELKQGQT